MPSVTCWDGAIIETVQFVRELVLVRAARIPLSCALTQSHEPLPGDLTNDDRVRDAVRTMRLERQHADRVRLRAQLDHPLCPCD